MVLTDIKPIFLKNLEPVTESEFKSIESEVKVVHDKKLVKREPQNGVNHEEPECFQFKTFLLKLVNFLTIYLFGCHSRPKHHCLTSSHEPLPKSKPVT